MKFQIIWTAVTQAIGQLSAVEEIDAETAIEALNAIRSPIIAKLSDVGSFQIINLNIKNNDGPTTVNLQEAYQVLNSLNAEGGMVKYEDPPSTFTITFEDKPKYSAD